MVLASQVRYCCIHNALQYLTATGNVFYIRLLLHLCRLQPSASACIDPRLATPVPIINEFYSHQNSEKLGLPNTNQDLDRRHGPAYPSYDRIDILSTDHTVVYVCAVLVPVQRGELPDLGIGRVVSAPPSCEIPLAAIKGKPYRYNQKHLTRSRQMSFHESSITINFRTDRPAEELNNYPGLVISLSV